MAARARGWRPKKPAGIAVAIESTAPTLETAVDGMRHSLEAPPEDFNRLHRLLSIFYERVEPEVETVSGDMRLTSEWNKRTRDGRVVCGL